MIAAHKPKPKKCKVCRKEFQPVRAIQPVCQNFDCAVTYATKAAERAKARRDANDRKDLREAKEKAKTRGKWAAEAQAAFNSFIRARDAGKPCISCGRHHKGSWDAGHYRARSVVPALRFNELNCHAQCVPCNRHMHGNLIEYRIRLIERIGVELVQWLEGSHEPKHYSISDLKAIKAEYVAKLNELNSVRCV